MFFFLVLVLLFSNFSKVFPEYHCVYDDYYPFISRSSVHYRTVLCSDVSSFQNLSYFYLEEQSSRELYLKIHDSNITTVPQSSFVRFSKLTALYLDGLNIKTLLPGAFNGLIKLQLLSLGSNQLTKVSKGVFNSLQSLKLLDLKNNSIYHIEDMAFLGTDNLFQLDLENNNLTKFDNGLLESQRDLKNLNLAGNPLTEFSLNGPSLLYNLNLSQTSLTNFNKDFSHLTVFTLNLTSSQLSTVNFKHFPSTREIMMKNNQIESLYNCQNLHTIRITLDNNRIKTINGTFKIVQHLSLSHNDLEVLSNNLFDESNSVRYIDFSFNKILTIEPSAFKHLTLLEDLQLQHNKISTLDPFVFRDLHQLKKLNLSNNRIGQFRFGTFDTLSNLEELDVSSNKLIKLHEETFQSLSSLTRLHFNDNKISSFSVKDLMLWAKNLQHVSMDKNAWKCENLYNISKELRFSGVHVLDGRSYKVENINGIACQSVNLTSTVKE